MHFRTLCVCELLQLISPKSCIPFRIQVNKSTNTACLNVRDVVHYIAYRGGNRVFTGTEQESVSISKSKLLPCLILRVSL